MNSNFPNKNSVLTSMISYISLRVFLVCLVICALMVLGGIWFQSKIPIPLYFQATATFFVIGLTSFLIWFSTTLLAIRELLEKR